MKMFLFVLLFMPIVLFTQNIEKKNTTKIWIVFQDKGVQEDHTALDAIPGLYRRALLRRKKTGGNSPLTDWYDLPLYEPYIKAVKPWLKSIRTQSRWLNALSAEVQSVYLDTLKRFDFIKQIDPVFSFKSRPFPEPQADAFLKAGSPHSDYGPSFDQVEQIGIPFLHEKGYYGQGVIIALLDAGYNQLDSHIAFKHLSILERWDFTEGDSVIDGSGHGLSVLGTIAGYTEEHLIGPAYGASFLLARTEVVKSETPVEEDYWVAGLEWAERRGADIVSSSLGYIDWYTWEDLDGKTAKVSIAADLAGRKGLLVFNSAGNEGTRPWKHVTPPADARHVLAIAAVNRFGERAAFSSVGPTYDNRIKPDLAAMGLGVYTATSNNANTFGTVNGTSFSCPLAAGAAAVLISAFPDMNPFHIVRALRETASQHNHPDTLLGWGIIDAAAAYSRLDSALHDPTFGPGLPIGLQITSNFPNPFYSETKIRYRTGASAYASMAIFDILGRRIQTIDIGYCEAYRTYEKTIHFENRTASGIYFIRFIANSIRSNQVEIRNLKIVRMKK